MRHLDNFRSNTHLIDICGERNAHLAWAISLYIEEPDVETLASESLTDGPSDKKLDLIYIDHASRRILLAQGYYARDESKDAAKANKASDLNTGAAWLVSGDLTTVPESIRSTIDLCREAIDKGEVDAVELLYVHNLPESVGVNRELKTAATQLQKALAANDVSVTGRELGTSTLEDIFNSQDSQIAVLEEISCPAEIQLEESGPTWR